VHPLDTEKPRRLAREGTACLLGAGAGEDAAAGLSGDPARPSTPRREAIEWQIRSSLTEWPSTQPRCARRPPRQRRRGRRWSFHLITRWPRATIFDPLLSVAEAAGPPGAGPSPGGDAPHDRAAAPHASGPGSSSGQKRARQAVNYAAFASRGHAADSGSSESSDSSSGSGDGGSDSDDSAAAAALRLSPGGEDGFVRRSSRATRGAAQVTYDDPDVSEDEVETRKTARGQPSILAAMSDDEAAAGGPGGAFGFGGAGGGEAGSPPPENLIRPLIAMVASPDATRRAQLQQLPLKALTTGPPPPADLPPLGGPAGGAIPEGWVDPNDITAIVGFEGKEDQPGGLTLVCHRKDLSFRKVARVSRDDLMEHRRALVQWFEKKCNEDEDYRADMAEGVRPEWLEAERVIDERNTRVTKEGHPRFGQVVPHVIVKWRCRGYESATTEILDDEFPEDESDRAALEAFRRRRAVVPGERLETDVLSLNMHELERVDPASFVNLPRPDEGGAGSAATPPPPPPPEQVEALPRFLNDRTLRSYQVEGLKWMVQNWGSSRSCILGDEMGLGKTAQSIATLEWLRQKTGNQGPFLIVAPLSTLGHWQREIETWTDMYVVPYYGNASDRKVITRYDLIAHPKDKRRASFHVVLTSPEIFTREHDKEFKRWKFTIVVVDEAHKLKSRKSKLFAAFSDLLSLGGPTKKRDRSRDKKRRKKVAPPVERAWRLLLTGTPIQNNVSELYSILSVLDPVQHPPTDAGETAFLDQYGGNSPTPAQSEALKGILKPVLLRRMKEDVEDLPEKEEVIVWVDLTPEQRAVYRATYEKRIGDLMKGAGAQNLPSLNNISMLLREVCNHPFLVKGLENQMRQGRQLPGREQIALRTPEVLQKELDLIVQASGKMVLLNKLLPKLKAEGRKVLIFSQFKIMLDVLQEYLALSRYGIERIDGNIKGRDRQDAIDRFMDPTSNAFVFLLSTRAGGQGITLTAADTVIIFDSDWNPQNDLQAMARCHRIGQDREVTVYRLLSKNTYEEAIFQAAVGKLGLDEAILGNISAQGGDASSKRRPQDIQALLRRGAEQLESDAAAAASNDFDKEDIDQILKARTERRSVGQRKGNTFSVADFASKREQYDKLSDADYWRKLLPTAVEAQEAAELRRLNEGKGQRKAATGSKSYKEEGLRPEDYADHGLETSSDSDVPPPPKPTRKPRAPPQPLPNMPRVPVEQQGRGTKCGECKHCKQPTLKKACLVYGRTRDLKQVKDQISWDNKEKYPHLAAGEDADAVTSEAPWSYDEFEQFTSALACQMAPATPAALRASGVLFVPRKGPRGKDEVATASRSDAELEAAVRVVDDVIRRAAEVRQSQDDEVSRVADEDKAASDRKLAEAEEVHARAVVEVDELQQRATAAGVTVSDVVVEKLAAVIKGEDTGAALGAQGAGGAAEVGDTDITTGAGGVVKGEVAGVSGNDTIAAPVADVTTTVADGGTDGGGLPPKAEHEAAGVSATIVPEASAGVDVATVVAVAPGDGPVYPAEELRAAYEAALKRRLEAEKAVSRCKAEAQRTKKESNKLARLKVVEKVKLEENDEWIRTVPRSMRAPLLHRTTLSFFVEKGSSLAELRSKAEAYQACFRADAHVDPAQALSNFVASPAGAIRSDMKLDWWTSSLDAALLMSCYEIGLPGKYLKDGFLAMLRINWTSRQEQRAAAICLNESSTVTAHLLTEILRHEGFPPPIRGRLAPLRKAQAAAAAAQAQAAAQAAAKAASDVAPPAGGQNQVIPPPSQLIEDDDVGIPKPDPDMMTPGCGKCHHVPHGCRTCLYDMIKAYYISDRVTDAADLPAALREHAERFKPWPTYESAHKEWRGKLQAARDKREQQEEARAARLSELGGGGPLEVALTLGDGTISRVLAKDTVMKEDEWIEMLKMVAERADRLTERLVKKFASSPRPQSAEALQREAVAEDAEEAEKAAAIEAGSSDVPAPDAFAVMKAAHQG